MARIDTHISETLAAGAAFAAALRVGIVGELVKGPTTETDLLDRLKLNRRAGRLVIDLLEAHQIAERDGDKVGPGASLRALGEYPGGYDLTLGMWNHVEQFLRTGEPYIAMDQSPIVREAIYQKVVGGLGTLMEPTARQLAEKLPFAPKTVLDVGCGSGVWSLAVAERHPDARVTGLDLPAVLDNFTARASSLSLGDRVQKLPGDMYAVDVPPAAYDLVVIANVLRLDVPEKAATLVERMAKAVAPNGSLMIVDALAHGSLQADRDRTSYALHLGLRTRSGEVHSPQTITKWLTRAGLSKVESIPLTDASNIGVLIGRRA